MPELQTAAAPLSLSREQKIGFIFLLVFAIVGLILGVLQIRNTIFAPFALTDSIPSTVKDSVNDVNSLRYRDTDGDGLSDYDETYVYGTSPYLYDSFGYGLSDKVVVERGLARCADAGKDCSNESTPLGVPTTTSDVIAGDPGSALDLSTALSDPKQVRELLLTSGMDKTLLDKLSDTELMAMVTQLMASSTFSSSTNP